MLIQFLFTTYKLLQGDKLYNTLNDIIRQKSNLSPKTKHHYIMYVVCIVKTQRKFKSAGSIIVLKIYTIIIYVP